MQKRLIKLISTSKNQSKNFKTLILNQTLLEVVQILRKKFLKELLYLHIIYNFLRKTRFRVIQKKKIMIIVHY